MLKAYIRARPKTSALDDSLPRRGWQESELATRRRSDPGKLASAARLRNETTLPIKWIAARLQIGTAKGAKSVLPHLTQSQDQRKAAKALDPCAQIEFQSTVGPLSGLGPMLRFQLSWVPIPPSSRNPPTRPTVAI